MTEPPNPDTDETLTEREIATMSPEDQVRYAVRNGCHRADRIDEVTQVTTTWTKDVLDEMVEANTLVCETDNDGVPLFSFPESDRPEPPARAEPKPSVGERPGDDTVDAVEADEADVAETASAHGGEIPVDRNYDWESEKLDPESVADYVDSNGEFADMLTLVERREEIDKLPRFRIPGPTGCGKTTAGEALAVELDAPCFIIECHDGLRPNNLLGMPTYVGDETWWVDGPVTKALLASQAANDPTTDFDEVVLIFDEANRTTSRTLGVIMSALDHRGEVTLNARGGETISGDPMNLVTVATMNEGDGYIVNPMDRAQKRRFGNTYPVDYIGMNDVDAEVDLLAKETPIGTRVAREMVKAANEIREKADDSGPVEMGVPTSSMLDWAKTAWAHRDRSADGGPVMKAARETIVNTFYAENEKERNVVTTTFESYVRGMALDKKSDTDDDADEDEESLADLFVDDDEEDDDALGDASEDDAAYDTEISVSSETFLMCDGTDGCGYYEEASEAPEEVVATMECPECGNDLEPVEAE